MAEPVAFISRFKIKDGQRAAYDELCAEVSPRIEAEWPGTLVYLTFLGPDDEVTIVHVFGDAEAADTHAEKSKGHSPRAMALLEPRGWEIYGPAHSGLLDALKAAATHAGVPLTVYPDFTCGFLRPSAPPVTDAE